MRCIFSYCSLLEVRKLPSKRGWLYCRGHFLVSREEPRDQFHSQEIRTTMSGYLDIVEEIVLFKNRLKSVFRAEAIQTDENSFYKNHSRVKELKN